MFFVVVLLIHFKRKEYYIHLKNKRMLLFTSTVLLFLLTFFSFIVTDDYMAGIKRGETRLSFFLIPILIVALDHRVIKIIIFYFYKGLILGVLISAVFLIISMIIRLSNDPSIAFLGYYNTHHSYSAPLSIHATYLSLYYIVALCLLYYDTKIIKTKGWVRFILALVIGFSLLMLSSRVILLAGIPILGYSILLHYSTKARCIILGVITVSFFVVVYFTSGSHFISRFKSIENELLGVVDNDGFTELRFSRWDVALDIIKNRPIMGYGLGKEKSVLEKGYIDNGMFASSKYRYDSHNQFLSILVTSGIIGFMIIIVFFSSLISFFFQKKDWFNLLFLFLVIALCFVETTFNVNAFTTFFAFIINVNLFKYS